MSDTLTAHEGAHSILGPSSAERWIACPGSVLATKGIADTPSPYATAGTAAHTLSEWVRHERRPAKDWLGTVIRVEHGSTYGSHTDVPIDQEMVDAVQEFCDRVAEQPGDELVEARVSYELWVPGGFGTLDSGKLNDGTCYLTDFKFGTGVEKYAQQNPQLMLYALGVLHDYGYLYDINEFVLAISQPRRDHYDEWTISVPKLLAWGGGVAAPAAQDALKPGARMFAGEHCQFCRIKATCKTRAKSVFETIVGEFESVETAVAATPHAAESIGLLSNDEVAKCLGAVSAVKAWCGAIEAHAMSELLHGRSVGDYKIVEGRSGRQWADEVGARDLLRGQLIDESVYLTAPETKSPAQVEKALGKKRFAELVGEFVTKPTGKPTLAPGSDPRPVMHINAADDFSNITGEE